MLLHEQPGLDLAPRRPVSGKTLTDEQRAIVAHDPSTTLIVTAYAGVGKTSTLIEIARAWPRKRGLYLAFNKAIADDANRKFAGTKVTAKTSHGYAFGMLGISRYADRLVSSIRWQHVRDAKLELVNSYLALDVMIDAVTSGIRAFAIDAAAKPTAWHCGIDSLPTTVKNGVMPILLRAIQKFYLYETSGLPFTHDMYLKRFEMGAGVSGEFDYLLVDEAQDLNPVLVSLVKKSKLPAIIVGDPFQSIYAWRGAVSAMKMFNGPTLPLSQSWRFGEDVARIANHLLNKTSDGLPRPVRGRPDHTTTVSHYPGRAPVGSFIIARTNARIFEGLVQMPRTFHVAGGFETLAIQILSAHSLSTGRRHEVRDPYVKLHATWEDLVHDGNERADPDAKRLTRIVETYGDQIPGIVERLRKLHKPRAEDAEYILSTAHKAKGLEFDTVILMDDFSTPEEIIAKRLAGEINQTACDQELNLLYVSATRAKTHLYIADPLYASLENEGVAPRRPEPVAPPPPIRNLELVHDAQ